MKHIDVKSSTDIDCGIENKDKYPKFKVGDHVRVSKYKKYLHSKLVGRSSFY